MEFEICKNDKSKEYSKHVVIRPCGGVSESRLYSNSGMNQWRGEGLNLRIFI